MTKEGAPLVGITLDDVAAISKDFFQMVPPAEEAQAASLPIGNRQPDKDFSTGEPLGATPVLAVMGDKAYRFSDTASLEDTNAKLASLDLSVSPKAGANVVFAMPFPADGGGVNWEAASAEVQLQASTWTETPKSVFCIRVDFPNLAGETVSQTALANVMNNTVASSITAMSYGKTTINATVSATTVRMPSATTAYLPANNDLLHQQAMDAYKAIAGPSSLDAYDIVLVHFPSIGMQGGGIVYAGLAGGSRQWLQGTTSSGVIIHEFGHNYGVGHASFWQTSDNSVTGTGTSVEYGDHTDIMGSGPDPEGHFHMQAKQLLNWMPTANWQDATATGSGTRRIYRFDSATTTGALRGVRVTKAASPAQYYWVGFRPGLPTLPAFQQGAYLLWQRPNETRSWLVDTTPGSTGGKDDSAVAIGRTFSDTTANVHITPIGKGGTGADQWLDVNVQIGPFAGNSAPTASISGPTATSARTAATFTANATDGNGDALSYYWNFGDGTIGENSATTSHQWQVGGTYTVTVTVSDMKGGTVTRTQSVTVSDPLATWSTRTSGTTADLYDIATGGGVTIAVGYDQPRFYGVRTISTDGTTWTSADIRQNTIPRAIIHDGTQFIIAGDEYDFTAPQGWRGAIFTSPNGTTWTRRHFSGPAFRAIAAGGGVYVAAGVGGTMWRSTDSINWSPVSSGVTSDITALSYGGGRFVAGANPNIVGVTSGLVLTSTDGATWTDRSAGSGIIGPESFFEIEYLNGRFIASGWYAKIRHSTDLGTTFSTTETAYRNIEGLAYGNGVYFAAGIDKSNGDADIDLISTDGARWYPLTTTTQADRRDAAFFNNTFITVGSGGAIRQSAAVPAQVTGYAAWNQTHFPDSPPLSGPNDDFDGDGVKNLMEYAMGTNPKNAASRTAITAVSQGGQLVLTVPRDSTATGVTITGTTSTTLSGWTTSGVTVLEDSSTQYRASIPIGTGKSFLRAEFTAP